VADLAVGGLSLGAGAALGGVIGGAISQGLGPLGRKLLNTLRDVHELSVDDGVLFVLADWQWALVRALERRGHAAMSRIQVEPERGAGHSQALTAAVRATAPARSHPEWARAPGRHRMDDAPQRQQAVAEVARQIARAFEAGA
jgi:hypothetical protein